MAAAVGAGAGSEAEAGSTTASAPILLKPKSPGNGDDATISNSPPPAVNEGRGAARPPSSLNPGVYGRGKGMGDGEVLTGDGNALQCCANTTAVPAAEVLAASDTAEDAEEVVSVSDENGPTFVSTCVSNDGAQVKHELLPAASSTSTKLESTTKTAAAPPPSFASNPTTSVVRAPVEGTTALHAQAHPRCPSVPTALATSSAGGPVVEEHSAVKMEAVPNSLSGASPQALAAAAAAAASAAVAARSLQNGTSVATAASTPPSTSTNPQAWSVSAAVAARPTPSQPIVLGGQQQPRPPVAPSEPHPTPPSSAAPGVMAFTPLAGRGLSLQRGPRLPFAGTASTVMNPARLSDRQQTEPASRGMVTMLHPPPQPQKPCSAGLGAPTSTSTSQSIAVEGAPSAPTTSPVRMFGTPTAPPTALAANGGRREQGFTGAPPTTAGLGGASPRTHPVGANGTQVAAGRGFDAVVSAGGAWTSAGGAAAIGGAGGVVVGTGGGISGGAPAGPGAQTAPGQALPPPPPGYVRTMAQGTTGAIMMTTHRGRVHDLTATRLGPGVPMNTAGGGVYGGAGNGDGGPIKENTGRWTYDEHRLFLRGLELHGKGWKKIASLIRTRTVVQIRTHAQKYFQKVAKAKQNGGIGGEHGEGSVDPQGKAVRRKNRGRRRMEVFLRETTAVAPSLQPYVASAGAVERGLYRFLSPIITRDVECSPAVVVAAQGAGPGGDEGKAGGGGSGDAGSSSWPLPRPAVRAGESITGAEMAGAAAEVAVLPPKWYRGGRGLDELLNQAERLDWLADSGGTGAAEAAAAIAAAAPAAAPAGATATSADVQAKIPAASTVRCAAADLDKSSAIIARDVSAAVPQAAVDTQVGFPRDNLATVEQGHVLSDLSQPSLKRVRSSGSAPSALSNTRTAAIASPANSAALDPAAETTTLASTAFTHVCPATSAAGKPHHQSSTLPLTGPSTPVSLSGTPAPTSAVTAVVSLSSSASPSAAPKMPSESNRSTAFPSAPLLSGRHGDAAASTAPCSVGGESADNCRGSSRSVNDTPLSEVGNGSATIGTGANVRMNGAAAEGTNRRTYVITPTRGDRSGSNEENIEMTNWIGSSPTPAVAVARGESSVASTAAAPGSSVVASNHNGSGSGAIAEALQSRASGGGGGPGLSPSDLQCSESDEERLSGLSDLEGFIEDQDLTDSPPMGAVSHEGCAPGARTTNSGAVNGAAAGNGVDNDAVDAAAVGALSAYSGGGGGGLDEGMDEDAFVAALLDA